MAACAAARQRRRAGAAGAAGWRAQLSLGALAPAYEPDDTLEQIERRSEARLVKASSIEAQTEAIKARMEAIRNKSESLATSGADWQPVRRGGPLEGYVFWCDSDPTVGASASIMRAAGLDVRAFSDPESLLQAYIASPLNVVCVMSSMMEGNGRKGRGAMNAYGLFAAVSASAAQIEGASVPILAVISISADPAAAAAAGADVVVLGNRAKAQNSVLSQLRKRLGLQGGFRAD